MAVKSIACMLVFVLVQATQEVPCVSARNLLQLPFSGIANGLANAIGAPPVSSPGVPSVANGLTNVASGLTSGLTNAASGLTNAIGAGSSPPSTASKAKPEEGPGTTITETFYISTTGLGSTKVTATTHIPPLSEIQIPDFKSFFSNLLTKQSSSPPAQSSTSSPPRSPGMN